jgi:hypothetical protein
MDKGRTMYVTSTGFHLGDKNSFYLVKIIHKTRGIIKK